MTLMNWPEMASTGEAILFGCVAVFMIACALGVLFFKKAVHCAICMVGVMLGLAILYLMHGAAFLGTVQVVVYTGAIMVLFLFVIMMIGLGASDNYAQQSSLRCSSLWAWQLSLLELLPAREQQAPLIP